MPDRYYEAEHFAAYERIRREGLNHWNDLHTGGEASAYEDFQGRDFLDRVLTTSALARGRRVFEYGCGTGAAACLLSERGFEVDAVDLVPDAIAVARRFAAARSLEIDFAVQDICQSPDDDGERYNSRTGIVWATAPTRVTDSVQLDGSWYVPNRRHVTAAALRHELERHGFRVLEQSGRLGGEVVCAVAD